MASKKESLRSHVCQPRPRLGRKLHTDRKNHLGERDDALERKLFVAFETNDHSLTVKEYSLTVNTRRQIT